MEHGVPCFTILNNKGGVGKTTLSILIAEYCYYILGKRVIILDWDGQLNLTKTYIQTEKVPGAGTMPIMHPELVNAAKSDPSIHETFNLRSTITDIFENKDVYPYPTPLEADPNDTMAPRVDVICGSQQGIKLLLESTPTEMRDSPFAHLAGVNTDAIIKHLVEFCAMPEFKESCDLIIIDSGPSDSPLFEAALRAATHVVCPYIPEQKSVSGIEGLLDSLNRAKKARLVSGDRPEPLKLVGLLPNMVDMRVNKHIDLMNETREATGVHHFPAGVVLRRLNSYTTYTDNYNDRPAPKSIFALKEDDNARQDAMAVMEHMMSQVFEMEAAA